MSKEPEDALTMQEVDLGDLQKAELIALRDALMKSLLRDDSAEKDTQTMTLMRQVVDLLRRAQ